MRSPKRLIRPLAAAAVLAVTVPAVALAPSASAATKDTGDAASTATVLSLRVGGETLKSVVAELDASTIDSPNSALVRVVPVTHNGTKIGEQTVTDDSKTVGSESQSVAGLVSVTSPTLGIQADSKATSGPVAQLTSDALGDISVLGVNLPAIQGKLGFGSSVVDKTSNAAKSVEVRNFRLPSLADLLANFGLDLNALPLDVLQELVSKLDLVTNAISNAIDDLADATANLPDAQDAVNDAAAAVAAAQGNVTSATAGVSTATTALLAALGAGNAQLPAIPTTIAGWDAANQSNLLSALSLVPIVGATLAGNISAADSALDTANSALSAANSTLATASGVLATLTAALQNLLDQIGDLTDDLTDLLVGALDTPLVALDKLEVGTIANAGGKHVAKVTGTVSGLEVLGTDVLDTVLGKSSIDVVKLVGSKLNQVQNKVDALTGQVSSVLSSVSGLTVALPKVTVLEQSTSKAKQGQYQGANTSVTGLAVSWGGVDLPAVSLPANLAVPNIGALPAVSQINNTYLSDGLDVVVVNLNDNARYLAAAGSNPTGVTPDNPDNPDNPSNPDSPNNPNNPDSTGGLPSTGVPQSIAMFALALLAGAFGLRKFATGSFN